MGIISQTKDTRYAEQAPAPSRSPETYVKEAWGRYMAKGGEISIDAGQLLGDRIQWSPSNVRQLRVIRGIGGEQIHKLPDTGSGWGINALNPPTIEFSTPLVVNEIVDVGLVNRLASIVLPQQQSFYRYKSDIPAGSIQSTFYLPRPMKLSKLNGVDRGQHYLLTVDGSIKTEGDDYTENRISGTDTFGSITFSDPVGDPYRDIGVILVSFGFYADDNLSQLTLSKLSDQLTYPGQVIQSVYTEITTSGTAVAQIPFDDTIPQQTEGYELLTVSITPKLTSSKLLVEARAWLGEEINTADGVAMAIFRDATADAIVTGFQQQYIGGSEPFGTSIQFGPVSVTKQISSVSTSATVFKMRIGLHTNTTIRWNGNNGTRRFGGSLATFLKISEIR